jgi:predicted nucleotidyltransferase
MVELSDKIASYRAFQIEKEMARKQSAVVAATDCLARIKVLSDAIRVDYPSITRVIVFGSLARGELQSASDIDIYIQGLPVNAYWATKARFARQTGRDVDLLTEADDPQFIELAFQDGCVVLYE